MLNKNFNKIGDTAYRVGSQIAGYVNFANFLISESKHSNILDTNVLDQQFKEFAKNEQIYNYKSNKVIQKRINFIMKLFKQLKLVQTISKSENIEINIEKIKTILEDPINSFFELLMDNFNWFKEGIQFVKENNSVNSFYFIIALQVYESGKDNFGSIYHSIINDFDSFFHQIVMDFYCINNVQDFNHFLPHDFIKTFRKPPKGKDIILQVLKMKKENNTIDDLLIYEMLKNTHLFNDLIKFKMNPLFKKIKKNNVTTAMKKYINSVDYAQFFYDLSASKIWKNIAKDYHDLMKRWFMDFQLIKQNKIHIEDIQKRERKYYWNEISENIHHYPYQLNQVNHILLKIQNNDYTFKYDDKHLKDIANSTLAEYFVNLHYALTKFIPNHRFIEYSRTKLQPGTLLPLIHAPGNGPDMYLLKDEHLTVIETTIHKNVREIRNHEVFNILDHINLDTIKYLSNETKEKIKKTEVILVTLLNSEEELNNIKNDLDYNHQNNTKNYGFQRLNSVTNFANLAKEK